MIEWFTNHSLLLLLAAATITSICWLFQANGRLNFKSWQVVTLGVAHTCLGVLAVKAFAIIEGFGDLSVVGNMSLFGGMALLPIFYGTLARKGHRDTRDVFDVLTMSLVMTLFFARINCIISGCCIGAFIPGTGLRWPTRELEMAYDAVLLAICIPRVYRGEMRGQMFPLYMVSYGVFRFITEFLRVSAASAGAFHIAHLWAGIAVVLGDSILVGMRQQTDRKARKVRV